MNRLILAPLALLAIPLMGAGQSTGIIDLKNVSSAQVAEAYRTQKPGAPIRPGQWERRYEITGIELPDVPAGAGRDAMIAAARRDPQVENFCQEVTTEQSAPEPKAVFEMMGEQCTYDHFRMGAGSFDAMARCSDADGKPVTNMVSGRYDPASFVIRMNIEMPTAGGRMKLAMSVSGRRTGECTK